MSVLSRFHRLVLELDSVVGLVRMRYALVDARPDLLRSPDLCPAPRCGEDNKIKSQARCLRWVFVLSRFHRLVLKLDSVVGLIGTWQAFGQWSS